MKALSVLKFASLSLSLASVAMAQNVFGTLTTKSATFTRNVGSSSAGAGVSMTGRASRLLAAVAALAHRVRDPEVASMLQGRASRDADADVRLLASDILASLR